MFGPTGSGAIKTGKASFKVVKINLAGLGVLDVKQWFRVLVKRLLVGLGVQCVGVLDSRCTCSKLSKQGSPNFFNKTWWEERCILSDSPAA